MLIDVVLIFNTLNIFEDKLMPRNTSVTLGEHFDDFVAEKIQEGRFQSVSEVVRAGLHKLEEDDTKLKALRMKLQAGVDSLSIDDFNSDNFVSGLHQKSA